MQLYPEAFYQFLVNAAKDAGQTFSLDLPTLLKRLDEAGLIQTQMEGTTRRRQVKVWMNGTTRRVIKMHRDVVYPPSPLPRREEWEGRELLPLDGTKPGEGPSHHGGNGHDGGNEGAPESRPGEPTLPRIPTLPGVWGGG
jgi:hypothetical protein